MREIKFRFWNGTEMKRVRAIDFNYDYFEDDHSHITDVEEIEYSPFLMQFTGLKDKNGKEIYEGDIVKYKFAERVSESSIEENTIEDSDAIVSEYIREVRFLNGEFFPIPKSNICDDYWYSWIYYDFEVIGNIYENQELLKGD